MKFLTKKVIRRLLGGILLAWLVLFVFTPPMPDTPRARGMISTLQSQAHELDGKELTREQLNGAISQLDIDFTLNRYIPDIRYTSPTNWQVTLQPQNGRSFANPASLFTRVTTLEFERIDYPDILIGSENEGAQQSGPAYPPQGVGSADP